MGEVIDFPNSHVRIEDKSEGKINCLVNSLLYCPNPEYDERLIVGMIVISIDTHEQAIIPLPNIEAVLTPQIATLTKTYIRELEIAVAILGKGGLMARIPNKNTFFTYGLPHVEEGESAFSIAKDILDEVAYFGTKKWDSSKP